MSKAEDKHYAFTYQGIKVDPYRIFEIYRITNPAQQHAIKKLLRAGKSVKSLSQDIDEVVLTLNRWKEMIQEDESMRAAPVYNSYDALLYSGVKLDAGAPTSGLCTLADLQLHDYAEPHNSYAEVHAITKNMNWERNHVDADYK